MIKLDTYIPGTICATNATLLKNCTDILHNFINNRNVEVWNEDLLLKNTLI